MLMAPASEDTQISRLARPGSAAVASEKGYDRDPFRNMQRIVIHDHLNGSIGVVVSGHGGLLGNPVSNGDGTTHARAEPETLLAAAIIGCPWKGRYSVVRFVTRAWLFCGDVRRTEYG